MPPPGNVRVRIAPSPTGDPHIGTAYAALLNYAFARRSGGKFLLRIEDTDRARYNADSERQILESLRWLGLVPDEGPELGGDAGPYRQSERLPIYREHVEQLLQKGFAYLCFCTAERLDWLRLDRQRQALPPGYDGFCRSVPPEEGAKRRAAGEKCVIRMKPSKDGETVFEDLPRGKIAIPNSQLDDQILMKSDGFPTYHLANVVDDHLMGTTHIIRGEEWLSSVPKHIFLYRSFGWDVPVMCHFPLLRNADRSKVSKRKNPTSIIWYRQQGYLPEALVNFLALMGMNMLDREQFTLPEWCAAFDLGKIGVNGPVFDLQKLDWLNGVYIRALPPAELSRRLHAEKFTQAEVPPALLGKMLPLIQERLKKLSEFTELAEPFLKDPAVYDPALLTPKGKTPAQAKEGLAALIEAYRGLADWTTPALEHRTVELMEKLAWKKGEIFMLVRVAVTAKTATPPICETMEAIGRDATLRRMQKALTGFRG